MTEEDKAQDLFRRLLANTDDFLEHRMEYPVFSERNRALWKEADADKAIHLRVSALLLAHTTAEMKAAMDRMGIASE